jgi:hypothetical protein
MQDLTPGNKERSVDPTGGSPAMSDEKKYTPRQWEVIASAGLGVVFIVSIGVLAIYSPKPSSYQYSLFRTVTALAAAGIGAILPGFLDITFKNWLRAGGAVALFVVVYFFAPAPPRIVDGGTTTVEIPKASSQTAVSRWFALLDAGETGSAYQIMGSAFRANYPVSEFQSLVGETRLKLGALQSRTLISTAPQQSPPGQPTGAYLNNTYRTRFKNDSRDIYEAVILQAENHDWHVVGYYLAVMNAAGQYVPYTPSP